MVMTEKILKEFLDDVDKRIQAELERLHEPTKKHIRRIVEDELRNYISIGTSPPANFPAGLIHEGDYYDETCAPKLGWAGAHEIDYDALEGV